MAAKKSARSTRKSPAKRTNRPPVQKKKTQEQKGVSRQVGAIFLFALSILLFALTVYPGDSGWLFLHNAMFGLFSYAAWFAAPLVLYTAIMLTLDRPFGSFGGKVALCGLLILEICGLTHLLLNHSLTATGLGLVKELYEGSVALKFGGVFSLPFGHWLFLLLGRTGSIITDIVLIFVTVLLLTGLTLKGFLTICTKPVKKISEAYQNQAEWNAQRKKARFDADVAIDEEDEKRKKREEQKARKKEALPMPEPASAKACAAVNEKLDALNQAFNPEDDTPPAPMIPVEAVAPILPTEEKEPAGVPEKEDEKEPEKEPEKPAEEEEETKPAYRFPPLSLLQRPAAANTTGIQKELEENAVRLVQVLESFGVSTKVIHTSRGPAVTRYELQPASGVKISKITNLADDIALNLAAGGLRIEAPIPGKAAVGIEVPNKTRSGVSLSEVVGSKEFKSAKSKLTVSLGRDITGNIALADIADMPHLLIAGTTGSGKSVCINTFIMSILYKSTPDEVKLLLIDPKVVELGVYNGIPHLLVPVVTDPKKASGALAWAVTEMMNRYKTFAETDTRNIKAYNALAEKDETLKPMPQIVIVIDELSDLMMAAPGEVEDAICRLAQMARAAGMHLLIATQRPSVDVITGLIKANIPSRIAFTVGSPIDSRTILDAGGADKLLGRGDMLFRPVGQNKAQRIQGCFVSDAEIESVVHFLTHNGEAQYDEHVAEEIDRLKATEKGAKHTAAADEASDDDNAPDEIFFKAVEVVVEAGLASTSLLQRKLKLGYARAARYMDAMEARGIIGPYEGSKPRKVLISKDQFLEMTLNNTLPAEE